MNLVIDLGDKAPDALERWLSRLTPNEYRELAWMDHAYYTENDFKEYSTIEKVARDWIEEHGGERDWWFFLDTKVVRFTE